MSIYSDVNSQNPKKSSLVTDGQSVIQSLRNLIRTRKGQRPFVPDYGCEFDDLLFEIITEDSAREIFDIITDAINVWEPRVEIEIEKSTVMTDTDDNSYEVTIVFNIIGLPTSYLIKEVISKNDNSTGFPIIQ